MDFASETHLVWVGRGQGDYLAGDAASARLQRGCFGMSKQQRFFVCVLGSLTVLILIGCAALITPSVTELLEGLSRAEGGAGRPADGRSTVQAKSSIWVPKYDCADRVNEWSQARRVYCCTEYGRCHNEGPGAGRDLDDEKLLSSSPSGAGMRPSRSILNEGVSSIGHGGPGGRAVLQQLPTAGVR